MKIAIVTDIHYGHFKESIDRPGCIQMDTARAQESLKEVIASINNQHVDLLCQLGDIIIPENHEADRERIHAVLDTLSTAQAPILSILGNHDIDNVSYEEYQNIVSQLPLNRGTVGNYVINNIEFWWMNHKKIEGRDRFDAIDINTIRQRKDKSKIQCFLTHYPLIIPRLTDTYFFGDNPEIAKIQTDNLQQLWQDNPLPTILLNGHLHFANHTHQQNVHQVTCIPFSDNLQSHHNSINHPCSHTIIEINDNHFIISTYSGGYVIAREECNLSS